MKNISYSNLDLLSINIFVHLYESKSATFVSHKLDIPSPKISRCLKHTREVFGNELFTRRKYGLEPNEFAARIYPIAKEIIECTQNIQQTFDEEEFISKHNFEISAPDIISYKYPKAMLNAIKLAGKDISFNISPWTKNSLDSIAINETDIGLSCCNNSNIIKRVNKKLNVIHLKSLESVYLICNNEHPILKEEITLESISHYPFINANIGHPRGVISAYQEYCKLNGIHLKTEVDNICLSGLFEYLRTSNAITLLPYSSIYNMINSIDDLHACKLSDIVSEELYSKVDTPNIYLVYNSENIKPNLHWVINNMKSQVEYTLV